MPTKQLIYIVQRNFFWQNTCNFRSLCCEGCTVLQERKYFGLPIDVTIWKQPWTISSGRFLLFLYTLQKLGLTSFGIYLSVLSCEACEWESSVSAKSLYTEVTRIFSAQRELCFNGYWSHHVYVWSLCASRLFKDTCLCLWNNQTMEQSNYFDIVKQGI